MKDRARRFATEAHGDQKYGPKPYIDHLDETVGILKEFDINTDVMLAAGYLHDILEDTDVDFDTLIGAFGFSVARIVLAVTDGPGDTRKQRKAYVYRSLKLYPVAIPIKLADRLANVRSCIRTKNDKLLKMYRKEHAQLSQCCSYSNPCPGMLDELSSLIGV
ncbi:MAG: HD domain-containing protein [bacterium]